MLRLDEFESLFRGARRERFVLEVPSVHEVLLVTDLDPSEGVRLQEALQAWFAPLDLELRWTRWDGPELQGVDRLLGRLQEQEVDLLVTYRNLETDAWCWNYSLGAYLSALLRATRLPVLLVPHPRRFPELAWRDAGLDDVAVLTDHLVGHHALVNWGVRMTAPGGRLHLTHVENDETFARYLEAISKIPSLDTDVAREAIAKRLLEEPRGYVESCAEVLREARREVDVRAEIRWGHRVAHFRELVEATRADLLVMPTLEADHLALHGVAYSLAVELVDTMLLMV